MTTFGPLIVDISRPNGMLWKVLSSYPMAGSPMTEFQPDDDAMKVHRDPLGNHTLISWMSWAIYRTFHSYKSFPTNPNKLNHMLDKVLREEPSREIPDE